MASDANAAVDAANTPTNGSALSTGALTPAAALNQLDQSVVLHCPRSFGAHPAAAAPNGLCGREQPQPRE